MNRYLLLACLLIVGCSGSTTQEPVQAPPIPKSVDGVEWSIGNWEPHLAAGSEGLSWGNHRAVVELNDADFAGNPVIAEITWRRADAHPEQKAIVVVDAETGEAVTNAAVLQVNAHRGEVVFQPVQGHATYHIYYMPWESTGGYYPKVSYPRVVTQPDPVWAARLPIRVDFLSRRQATRIESVDAFHSFFPMEVVASLEETDAAMRGEDWALFPEHRERPIRLTRSIPHHWATAGPGDMLQASALRGEYFAFQVGVFAAGVGLEDLAISYEGFPSGLTPTCFNCQGVDENGLAFVKSVSVPEGRVQALWFGVQIPEDATPGEISGSVAVAPRGLDPKQIAIAIDIAPASIENSGFDQPEFQSRLAWLNSTAGTDPDFIIDPFTPVEIESKTLSILGREVDLGSTGFPDQIWSYFSPELKGLTEDRDNVLTSPLGLEVTVAGTSLEWSGAGFEVERQSRGRASWTAVSSAPGFEMSVEGALEYDGMLDYRVTLKATLDTNVDDIALPIFYAPDAATWMLGLGRKGGRTPSQLDWTWKVENHQEGLWLGGVHKGLQYVLRDENYARPLNTNFYQNQPLNMPPSWFNDGKGGITLEKQQGGVEVRNYSGPRTLAAGEELHFNIRFLITPFKPIETDTHFRTRFVHKYVPVDSVKAWGGTVVNIHHANEINPYINYPFFALDQQTAYITEAHQKGIKVKLYNTIREVTYRAHELFALKSLGDEIINDGEGGGHSWMQEHLREGYHSAWHAWRVDDAAMLNKGTSRWTNYYIEGLSWLAQKQEIDGLYLDDIAFSRETVKRLVSVLDEHRDEVVIDLHSANQFNPADGFINSAMLYMEHFPFISRLWFGEYFDYGADPDYWMTEVSGIPFGLMGEMLQDGGHAYRGLLYGMTTRMYGDVDPRPVWKMMNDFGIDESRMVGYWLDPVSVDRSGILGTAYVRPGQVLIALASWSDQEEVISLDLDLRALGLSGQLAFSAPAVDGLQTGEDLDPAAVRVPAGQGLYVLVTER
jgi:hypothetical protein